MFEKPDPPPPYSYSNVQEGMEIRELDLHDLSRPNSVPPWELTTAQRMQMEGFQQMSSPNNCYNGSANVISPKPEIRLPREEVIVVAPSNGGRIRFMTRNEYEEYKTTKCIGGCIGIAIFIIILIVVYVVRYSKQQAIVQQEQARQAEEHKKAEANWNASMKQMEDAKKQNEETRQKWEELRNYTTSPEWAKAIHMSEKDRQLLDNSTHEIFEKLDGLFD